MNSFWWQAPIVLPNQQIKQQAIKRQSELTKPQGSLGELEHIAIELAAMQGQVKPTIQQPHMLIFAADHGVVAQGVSAFPQSVTIAMLANFVQGGAAVSALCRAQNIALRVINCGTASACEHLTGIEHQPIAQGTADFSQQAAMSLEQAQQALLIGKQQVEQVQQQGCDFLLAGEMGIGNTSAGSALAAVLLNLDVISLTGPGTGVQGDALTHKAQVLAQSVARAKPMIDSPLAALMQLGGFELGALAGAYLRAAQLKIPMLVDGFISTSAAILATQLNPNVREWMLFAHQSAEPGHQQLVAALQAKPLLNLNMRLGEGSGAATAFALVKNALAVHNQMATFAEAAVANKSS